MEIIKETVTIEDSFFFPSMAGKPLFVDIETLGLQAAYHAVYLIGTAYFTESAQAEQPGQADTGHQNLHNAEITLYFAAKPDEEADILRAFAKHASDFDTVYTYNGTTFDLPFLQKRCAKYRMPSPCADMVSMDLYKIFKKRKQILQLPGCRQKDIECFLGIDRIDEMSGGELIDVYKQYAAHPSAEAHNLLVQHNLDDVRGMLMLLPMMAYERLSEVRLDLTGHSIDTFPSGTDGRELCAADSAVGSNSDEMCSKIDAHYMLTAKMDVTVPRPVRHRTKEYYLILEKNMAKCAFILHDNTVRYYWDNPKDYVYLIKEERILPKSLARTVPQTEKRKPAPEECYSEISICDESRPADQFLCNYLQKIIRALFK